MQFKQVDVDSLKAYPQNARTHNEKQVAQIAESIKEFGFLAPCLVDKDNVLIVGHGRLMAAKTLGMKKVPTLRIEHLTPDQVKAYRIADNQLAANADWDIDLLKMEMEGLTGQGFDIDIIGFHASELNFDKIDYSILDDDTAIDEAMDAMKEGVKKAIQIEFEAEHYEEAVELVKWWRDKKAYIGYMFMTFLKKEKQKV